MDPVEQILSALSSLGIPQGERSEVLNFIAKRAQSAKRLQFNFGEESRQGKSSVPPLPAPRQVDFTELQTAKAAEGSARFPFLQQVQNSPNQAAVKTVTLKPPEPSTIANLDDLKKKK